MRAPTPQTQAPAAAPAPAILSPGASAARRPATEEEFDAYFKEVSNWNRWGAADELGAANLITDAKRKQAASLVRIGRAVGLAHSPLTTKDVDNASPFEHTMNKPGFSMDTYRVSYHGYAHSHLDSLCHILYKDQTYNGYARADDQHRDGLHEARHPGLPQRLRHARHPDGHGAGEEPALPRSGHADLRRGSRGLGEACRYESRPRATRCWSAPAAGRGATPSARGTSGRTPPGCTRPPAAWLKARGVALIGSDAALDVVPSLVTGINLPVHTLAITALGINILDNQDLEALGELAAGQKRWEFMLTVAPVPVTGGTGFPVNALATY